MLHKHLLFHQHKLNNRYVVAPMTRISAEEDGRPNDTMKAYYERFAKGGFAMIITEGIYPDEQFSQGYFHQPGLANDEQMEAWKPVVKSVHSKGALIIAQLMHAGGQSQGNRFTEDTMAPSAIAPKGNQLEFYGGSGPFQTPKAATPKQLDEVKKSFAISALRAKESGFDGVELHGANGYLLDQFLTDYLNQREDMYGGTVNNRLRLLLETIEEVRAAVGEDFTVGIRISQAKVADSEHKWAGGQDEAETIFKQLGTTSLDYIHVTDADATQSSFGEGTFTLAEAAKSFSGLPVIANGQLQDPHKAASVLEKGHADLVSIGTGALANPDLPNRVQQGGNIDAFDFEQFLFPIAKIKDHELNKKLYENH